MSLIFSIDSSVGKPSRSSIYVGGKNDAKNREWMEQVGIAYILNVTPPKESGIKAGVANYFESSGQFKYRRIPVYDASTSDLLEHANAIVSFIATALIHGSILVHCHHGVSRSPSCVAFYLMSRQGMSLEAAMALLKAKRPAINPIASFQKQLRDYERMCLQSAGGQKRKRDGQALISPKRKASSECKVPIATFAEVRPEDPSGPAITGPKSLPLPPSSPDKDSMRSREGNNEQSLPAETKPFIGPSSIQPQNGGKMIGPMMPPL